MPETGTDLDELIQNWDNLTTEGKASVYNLMGEQLKAFYEQTREIQLKDKKKDNDDLKNLREVMLTETSRDDIEQWSGQIKDRLIQAKKLKEILHQRNQDSYLEAVFDTWIENDVCDRFLVHFSEYHKLDSYVTDQLGRQCTKSLDRVIDVMELMLDIHRRQGNT